MVGAVKPRCGSLAISVPPEAERSRAAAHAFDAPARSKVLNGDRGDGSSGILAANCGRPGASWAYSGKAAMPLPGASGRMSASRS